jgi:hypothetical protein
MLLRGLSPRANLTFLAAFRGRPAHNVAEALARWGLGAVMDRPMDRLSAGQRDEAGHRPEEGRLAGAVRSPYEGQPGEDLESHPFEDGAVVQDDRGIVEGCGR